MEKLALPDVSSCHQALKTSWYTPPHCQCFQLHCVSDLEFFHFTNLLFICLDYKDEQNDNSTFKELIGDG